ncbi:MAG: WecB/TagA/CpsF family glycosyltransferase [Candidatus Omnitrophica bacterium]|nr:WecB/TagA/CpsF family glycosyltransferase [Candidatus Omnitrophota bacterium]
MRMMKSVDICDVPVSSVNIPQACDVIDGRINDRKKVYICVAPVSTIVDCQSDHEYKKVLNNADMITPDGMPLVWIGKLKGDKNIGRTYGPDLMQALCRSGEKKGYKHYLYGSTESTCGLLRNVLKRKFPNIDIRGHYAPPYRPVHAQEDESIVNEINSADPDILWVGLGSPKQDFWMYEHRAKLKAPIIIGVGAAFDFIAGVKKQAPRWMRRFGLEWFFRLCSEPKRLWKRYFLGNTKFIYLLIKHSIKSRFRNKR